MTYARMVTLRTPKHLTGLEYGNPNLTLQAYYEARFGEEAWARLDKVPKEMWRAFSKSDELTCVSCDLTLCINTQYARLQWIPLLVASPSWSWLPAIYLPACLLTQACYIAPLCACLQDAVPAVVP